jgi:hypothetical protein
VKVHNSMVQKLLAEKQMDTFVQKSLLLRSKRDIPLVCCTTLFDNVSVVTVELYVKWYSLHVIRRIGDEFVIEEVPFPDDIEFCKSNESAFVDHVPNPRVVARWATANGHVVDELAMELMIGRWEIEAQNNYDAVCLLPEPPPPSQPCQHCGGKGYVEVKGLTHPVLGQAIDPCPKCALRDD